MVPVSEGARCTTCHQPHTETRWKQCERCRARDRAKKSRAKKRGKLLLELPADELAAVLAVVEVEQISIAVFVRQVIRTYLAEINEEQHE
jgi:hypothetical protein